MKAPLILAAMIAIAPSSADAAGCYWKSAAGDRVDIIDPLTVTITTVTGKVDKCSTSSGGTEVAMRMMSCTNWDGPLLSGPSKPGGKDDILVVDNEFFYWTCPKP